MFRALILAAAIAVGVTLNGVHYKYRVATPIAYSFQKWYRVTHPRAACGYELSYRAFVCSTSRVNGSALTRPYWRQYYVYVIRDLKVVRVYRYRVI